MGHCSFRFLRTSDIAGATLTIVCEGFHPPKYAKRFIGDTCTFDVYDIGPGGRKISGKSIATFTAILVEGPGKLHPPYYFKALKRTDSGPTALPGPVTSRTYTDPIDGAIYNLTYEPEWIPPYFKLSVTPVPGSIEPPQTILIPDQSASRERYFHDLAFTVTAGGAKIFDSARNPIRLDCNALLAHNCREAAEMMMNDHQALVDGRGVGLNYGSQCSVTAADKHKYSLKSTNCISYLLSALELGHEKTGAANEWNSIHKSVSHGDGITLAKGLRKHRWVTLFFMPDSKNFRDLDWNGIKWRRHHHRDALPAAMGKGGHKGYYQSKSIGVEDLILDYNPTLEYYKYHTPAGHTPAELTSDPDSYYYWDTVSREWVEFPKGMPEIEAQNGTIVPLADVTPAQTDKFDKLKVLDFGVINVVDGYHTAFLGRGMVYEAHWDKPPTDKSLYTKNDFQTWQNGYWGDGIVQLPATLWKP
jgi:hypothetical protein